jgi:hypothetical protein
VTPCGGINSEWGTAPAEDCFTCRGKLHATPCTLFCEEWDCHLHRECLSEFLHSEEGRIVIEHGHAVEDGGEK